ncbi:MAG: hypothetical protein MZV70_33950 [Desulfobacterales bacterium]|nr:hypothetical protein [Desulfobacterales bacterium]
MRHARAGQDAARGASWSTPTGTVVDTLARDVRRELSRSRPRRRAGARARGRQPEPRRRRARARAGGAARGGAACPGVEVIDRVPAAGRARARPGRSRARDLRRCAAAARRRRSSCGGSRQAADFLHTSHALSPEAVLATYRRVTGETPPEAWLLCVPGESFELGERLSATAAAHLEAAWVELRRAVLG